MGNFKEKQFFDFSLIGFYQLFARLPNMSQHHER